MIDIVISDSSVLRRSQPQTLSGPELEALGNLPELQYEPLPEGHILLFGWNGGLKSVSFVTFRCFLFYCEVAPFCLCQFVVLPLCRHRSVSLCLVFSGFWPSTHINLVFWINKSIFYQLCHFVSASGSSASPCLPHSRDSNTNPFRSVSTQGFSPGVSNLFLRMALLLILNMNHDTIVTSLWVGLKNLLQTAVGSFFSSDSSCWGPAVSNVHAI